LGRLLAVVIEPRPITLASPTSFYFFVEEIEIFLRIIVNVDLEFAIVKFGY
jgi:hypothetical protein